MLLYIYNPVFFFFSDIVYYYPRMSFDDILVFRSRVISKLFCVRGNCYGNFNGQTTGDVTSTLKVAGDLKLFINDCNVFLARNYHCIER